MIVKTEFHYTGISYRRASKKLEATLRLLDRLSKRMAVGTEAYQNGRPVNRYTYPHNIRSEIDHARDLLAAARTRIQHCEQQPWRQARARRNGATCA